MSQTIHPWIGKHRFQKPQTNDCSPSEGFFTALFRALKLKRLNLNTFLTLFYLLVHTLGLDFG